jgi:hypothetical protein
MEAAHAMASVYGHDEPFEVANDVLDTKGAKTDPLIQGLPRSHGPHGEGTAHLLEGIQCLRKPRAAEAGEPSRGVEESIPSLLGSASR